MVSVAQTSNVDVPPVQGGVKLPGNIQNDLDSDCGDGVVTPNSFEQCEPPDSNCCSSTCRYAKGNCNVTDVYPNSVPNPKQVASGLSGCLGHVFQCSIPAKAGISLKARCDPPPSKAACTVITKGKDTIAGLCKYSKKTVSCAQAKKKGAKKNPKPKKN